MKPFAGKTRSAYLRWAARTRQELAKEGWQEVSDEELSRAISDARQDGGIFNGCTDTYLRIRFGSDNVCHVHGLNWFKRTQSANGALGVRA